jgi:hypothetical protein
MFHVYFFDPAVCKGPSILVAIDTIAWQFSYDTSHVVALYGQHIYSIAKVKLSLCWMKHHSMKMYGEIEWGGMDWTCLAQDRDQWRAFMDAVMNLRAPYNAGRFLSSSTTGGLSSSAFLHN